jgi:hypothetical protein
MGNSTCKQPIKYTSGFMKKSIPLDESSDRSTISQVSCILLTLEGPRTKDSETIELCKEECKLDPKCTSFVSGRHHEAIRGIGYLEFGCSTILGNEVDYISMFSKNAIPGSVIKKTCN